MLIRLSWRIRALRANSVVKRNSNIAACHCSTSALAGSNEAQPHHTHKLSDVTCSTRQVVLGIESSCDDTGAAVVASDGTILGMELASQTEVHKAFGGVVPSLAQEAHAAAIDQVVDKAMAKSGLRYADLDAIAVTVGPGLSLCLRVGVLKTRALAHAHQLPVVPCHHMEAHALVARMGAEAAVQFPFMCLLVSGGHNLLLLARGIGDYMQVRSSFGFSV